MHLVAQTCATVQRLLHFQLELGRPMEAISAAPLNKLKFNCTDTMLGKTGNCCNSCSDTLGRG